MSLQDDINKIAKQKKQKQPLPDLNDQADREAEKNVGVEPDEGENGGNGLVSPVTLEILTYDDEQDVLVEANNGDFVIKTAATAKIIDAEETEILIDVIIYPVAP